MPGAGARQDSHSRRDERLLRLSAKALSEDVKFDLRHFSGIERLALIGDRKWEKGMAAFCKPFTTAEVRYSDHDRGDEARRWIEERVHEPS